MTDHLVNLTGGAHPGLAGRIARSQMAAAPRGVHDPRPSGRSARAPNRAKVFSRRSVPSANDGSGQRASPRGPRSPCSATASTRSAVSCRSYRPSRAGSFTRTAQEVSSSHPRRVERRPRFTDRPPARHPHWVMRRSATPGPMRNAVPPPAVAERVGSEDRTARRAVTADPPARRGDCQVREVGARPVPPLVAATHRRFARRSHGPEVLAITAQVAPKSGLAPPDPAETVHPVAGNGWEEAAWL
jgi:hypothetical protein